AQQARPQLVPQYLKAAADTKCDGALEWLPLNNRDDGSRLEIERRQVPQSLRIARRYPANLDRVTQGDLGEGCGADFFDKAIGGGNRLTMGVSVGLPRASAIRWMRVSETACSRRSASA